MLVGVSDGVTLEVGVFVGEIVRVAVAVILDDFELVADGVPV